MARIGEGEGPRETVQVETLDRFLRERDIDTVDILKIDVEGFEMQVLAGAEEALSENRVALVKLECGVDPDTAYHVSLQTVCERMFARVYRLFGLYDQWEYTLAPTPALRRVDAAFVSCRASRVLSSGGREEVHLERDALGVWCGPRSRIGAGGATRRRDDRPTPRPRCGGAVIGHG